MAFIERRVLEVANGQLDLQDLPPELQQRVREHEKRGSEPTTLAEAKRRTAELLREMRELA